MFAAGRTGRWTTKWGEESTTVAFILLDPTFLMIIITLIGSFLRRHRFGIDIDSIGTRSSSSSSSRTSAIAGRFILVVIVLDVGAASVA